MMERDSKGRFVSTKTTNANVKENNTMNNSRENRMATLNNSGINTSNFFDVNMTLPMGAMIQVTMPNGEVHKVGGNVDMSLCDTIAQDIIDGGYVNSTKLFRRWILAKTIKMLGTVTCEYDRWNKRNVYRSDWDKSLKRIGYMYQFEQTLEELRVLSILEKEDIETFNERKVFFTKDVIVALCNNYVEQLKKYIKKCRQNRKRTCNGVEYVRLAKYGDVFIDDLGVKVFSHMYKMIRLIEESRNHSDLYVRFREFTKLINKLPYDTAKAPEWKTAFKASGAYYSLKNMIMFHDVIIPDCNNMNDSLDTLRSYVNTLPAYDYWKIHELLKRTVYETRFDLAKSIEAHSNN